MTGKSSLKSGDGRYSKPFQTAGRINRTGLRIRLHFQASKASGGVYRRFLNKELTEKHMQQLLKSGKTRLIKGFEGKAGKTFDARLAFDKHFNLTFKFPEKKNGPGGKTKPKQGTTTKK